MFAILPVFALALVVLALVASDYHTRSVRTALAGMPRIMERIALERHHDIIIDTAHARMMRRAAPALGVMVEGLTTPVWCVSEKPEIRFVRSWGVTMWERLILAFGVITALTAITGIASAQDVADDLVCHIVNKYAAVCHTEDYSAQYVCAWTVDSVSDCVRVELSSGNK